MIRPILIHPDPRLKKPCETVADFGPALRQLSEDMLETMYDAPGIGLAAPQIGVMQRVLVMDCIKDGPPRPMVMVNPSITWASEDLSVYEEGCLSIPDQYAEVKRPALVRVAWQD
nr:peptide deformylase [Cypionkella sp.]